MILCDSEPFVGILSFQRALPPQNVSSYHLYCSFDSKHGYSTLLCMFLHVSSVSQTTQQDPQGQNACPTGFLHLQYQPCCPLTH